MQVRVRSVVYVALPGDTSNALTLVQNALKEAEHLQNPLYFFEDIQSARKPVLKALKRLDRTQKLNLVRIWVGKGPYLESDFFESGELIEGESHE